MFDHTIAAIATGEIDAAISIVRLSGDDAVSVVNRIFSADLTDAEGYTIHHGTILDQGQPVDDVLVTVFRAPASYTGEDIVEINCHGGVFVTRKVLRLCLGNGAKMARRGEFTERAFLNGKMDLSQAEAVNDLIHAHDQLNADSAIHSVKGSIRKLLDPLTESLIQIIAQIEVNIDYPEYDDVEELTNQIILPQAREWIKQLAEIIDQAEKATYIRAGINTVILGKPNVGKSSLLNALLEEEKAIVTDVAGTTRDIVEGSVRVGNVTLNLVDTAGIHETDDVIEGMGIERSLNALKKAQLVIVVLDSSNIDEEDEKLLAMTEGYPRIIVYNKSDLHQIEGALSVSARTREIDELRKA
ncbi:MAG: tRNA uridine-5-carboxymethylaminomethyl(34) synthesis GTPase MnmE, partial [Solobacterium sp.]|nr:tRNA uridine-5-carboxymethylaminomethyl(34) synthesis GTPase MnmE [Solobacterium sp.]